MFNPARATTAHNSSRRTFLKHTGTIAAASSLTGAAIPQVHAAGEGTIKLALIGCGGRGSGAVANALSAPGGPVKLIAMADIFEDRLRASHQELSKQFGDKIDVPPERRFIGFDAYRKAIDCLGAGDVAMLTGYTAFRPTQLGYAVEKGVNVFMEKPFAPDPMGVRQIIQAGEIADNEFATYVHGTKCAGLFCVWGASPINTRTYHDQRIATNNIAWKSEPEVNPWQVEWNVLLDAIRHDRPHNEARRAAYADLASIMGRAAVHSGKVITWEEALASKFQFCPNVASLTADSPAPVHADAQGRYPAPIPGQWSEI